MSKPKLTVLNFTLKNVNLSKINTKYGIKIQENSEMFEENPNDTTKLTELNKIEKGTPEIISFLDESKRTHVCHISMIDYNSKMNINLLRYHCFWCRNPFETNPIGCPIKYISSQAVKKYHSHISRDTYTIKENITRCRRQVLKDDNFSINLGEYYETDGVFCSFNCCQAFINDSKHMRLYDNSAMLLTKMYNDMMKTKTITITPAPHWRILEHFGGHLNINQFRDGFNKVDYECHGFTKNLPRFEPIGVLFEEKMKF
jgi:hypothetical protein